VPHRQRCPALYAGRAVADDPVEFGAQFFDDLGDAVFGQRILVAGLRRRKQAEILEPLVADQRLRQLGDAVDDVDQVEDHPPLGAHHQVEIAQPDVEIDDADFFPLLGQRSAKRSR
jgi:hypothetical protein